MTLYDRRSHEIAAINDCVRGSLQGLDLILASGILCLPFEDQYQIIQQVRRYDCMKAGRKCGSEHDFGALTYKGNRIYWKFEYQDRRSLLLTPNPADEQATRRLLRIFRAEEY